MNGRRDVPWLHDTAAAWYQHHSSRFPARTSQSAHLQSLFSHYRPGDDMTNQLLNTIEENLNMYVQTL